MIGLVTLYHSNYQLLADLVLPNLKEYCARHGYKLLAHCGNFGGGQIGFQKIRWVSKLMEEGLELALVTDLDIVITNLSKKFEDFTDDDHDLFITEDVNGLNCGSFIMRKSEWSMELLEFILSECDTGRFTCEQNVLKHMVGRKDIGSLLDRMKILPHPSINSYLHPSLDLAIGDVYPEWASTAFPNAWHEGDFLLHLPGMNLDQRMDLMRRDYIKNRMK